MEDRAGDLVATEPSWSNPIGPAGFDQVVAEHQKAICRVLLVLLRDGDAADTLTQECFLRAYNKRASFRGECSLRTWLLRIAINLAHDHRKNRRIAFWRRLRTSDPEPETGGAPADQRGSPERILIARDQLKAVWSALDQLSPQQRAVFLLRFVEEMEIEEIAQVMHLAAGTVKSHLFRAVGAVRTRLNLQGLR